MIHTSTRAKTSCLILLLAWTYAAWPMLVTMFKTYATSGYDYQGFFAIPLFIAFLQQQRNGLNRINLTSTRWSLVLLPLLAVTWLFASLTKLVLLEQVAVICMLPLIFLTTCGFKITRALLFPLLALLFLIPFGEPLYNTLQHLFSLALLYGFGLTKLSVYWEQHNIFIAKQEYNLQQICHGLNFASLYLIVGFCIGGYVARNLIVRLIIITNFILVPFSFLLAAIFAVILFRSWRNLDSISPTLLNIVSWSVLSLGLICATYLAYLLRSKQPSSYRNDGIDWRNEFSRQQSRWLPITIFASILLASLPTINMLLKNNQNFVDNWHDPKTLSLYKDVTLQINYSPTQKETIASNLNLGQQVRSNKIMAKINGKTVPVTETINIDKYHGKISWTFHFTNGHLTNSPTYAKMLDNIYALSKSGSKSADITLSTDLGKNVQASRDLLQQALCDLQKNAKTVWLR